MSLCQNLKQSLGESLRLFGDICGCQNLSYTSVHCLVRPGYLPLAALTSSIFTQQCLLMSDYLTSLLGEYKKVHLFSRRSGNWLQAIVLHQDNKCLTVPFSTRYSTLSVNFYYKRSITSGVAYDGYIVI
jgi:hypothetical protein